MTRVVNVESRGSVTATTIEWGSALTGSEGDEIRFALEKYLEEHRLNELWELCEENTRLRQELAQRPPRLTTEELEAMIAAAVAQRLRGLEARMLALPQAPPLSSAKPKKRKPRKQPEPGDAP